MIIFIVVILFLIIYYYFFYEKNEKETIIEFNEVNSDTMISENSNNNKMIYVDIKGCVAKPGVYSFKIDEDARINDLIIKSGGLLKDADTSILNLSKKIEDEMTVVIYSKKEIEKYLEVQNNLIKKLELCEQKIKNNACIEKETNNWDNNKININIASKEELETIPGIGSSKAESIINYRNKTAFKTIDDIKNVDGIGESLFENIKENITV